jgi:hypothetical protein
LTRPDLMAVRPLAGLRQSAVMVDAGGLTG